MGGKEWRRKKKSSGKDKEGNNNEENEEKRRLRENIGKEMEAKVEKAKEK